LENTIQRPSWRPNFTTFIPWLIALPRWPFRFLVALVTIPFLIPAFLLNGGVNLIPMVIAVIILVWRAPWLREKIQALPSMQVQMVFTMLAMGIGFIAFSAPWLLGGTLPLNNGLMSLIFGLSSASQPIPMFIKLSKQMEALKPKINKTKPIRVAKDPALRTNTQKKRDARLLKPTK
jgi:hypothetical protein